MYFQRKAIERFRDEVKRYHSYITLALLGGEGAKDMICAYF